MTNTPLFSLTDANARKVYAVAVLLEKNILGKGPQNRLMQHMVVARSDAEAFGILTFAYLKKDRDITFKYWTFTEIETGADITDLIRENNSDLSETLEFVEEDRN